MADKKPEQPAPDKKRTTKKGTTRKRTKQPPKNDKAKAMQEGQSASGNEPLQASGIKDRDSLRRWLETRSEDEARIIALRTALRVFPLTFRVFDIDEKHLAREDKETLVLQSFRALAVNRAFIDNPGDRAKIGIAAYDAAAAYDDAAAVGSYSRGRTQAGTLR